MKYKPKPLKSNIIFAVMIAAVIFFLNYLGIETQRSATRIGYAGKDGWL